MTTGKITDPAEIKKQVLEEMRAGGASEEFIEATRRGMEESERRYSLYDPEVERLRKRHLNIVLPNNKWVVRDFGDDGGIVENNHTGRRVILSISRELDNEVWFHASISRRDRKLPTYDDLLDLHRIFMPDLVAYQLFVPESEHVNFTQALHLWACLTKRITPDFTAGTGSV